MRAKPFSRPTLIAAVELLEGHSQARFNQMVLRLGLEDEIDSGTAVSVAKKCDILGRVIVQRSEQVLNTLDGTMTLGEAANRQNFAPLLCCICRGCLMGCWLYAAA